MKKRLILAAPSLGLAFLILLFSIFRTTGINYVFSMEPNTDQDSATASAKLANVEYDLPELLEAYPNDFFWPIKAFNDRAELFLQFDPIKKATVMLSHADERLVAGLEFVEDDNFGEGLHILAKSEDYLYDAVMLVKTEDSPEATEFMLNANQASLKHRQVMEKVLILSPDDARPYVVEIIRKTKLSYTESRVYLESHDSQAYPNPFDLK